MQLPVLVYPTTASRQGCHPVGFALPCWLIGLVDWWLVRIDDGAAIISQKAAGERRHHDLGLPLIESSSNLVDDRSAMRIGHLKCIEALFEVRQTFSLRSFQLRF